MQLDIGKTVFVYITLICFNTASGRYCCNLTDCKNADSVLDVSIPQAVGTVATSEPFVVPPKIIVLVSIPQAVGTVATVYLFQIGSIISA